VPATVCSYVLQSFLRKESTFLEMGYDLTINCYKFVYVNISFCTIPHYYKTVENQSAKRSNEPIILLQLNLE